MYYRLDSRGTLVLHDTTEDEASTIRHHVDAFVSACKDSGGGFRHPGLNKRLRKLLTDLSDSSSKQVLMPHEAPNKFLRWCITEGPHLQDERRENARALWRVMFRGTFPDFVRWGNSTQDYEEDLDGYLQWCVTQVEPAVETFMP